MESIPRDKSLDSSLALLRDGYRFVQLRRQRHRSDIFQTRLMLEPAICIGGEEAARLFYDPELFRRSDAVPKFVRKSLMGEGGVQVLDGEAHRHRKAMFLALMDKPRIERLMALMAQQWQAAIRKWEANGQVILFREAQDILCRAACAWTGIPLKEEEVRARARDMGAMVDGFGAIGPRHWRGRRARRRSEDWIMTLIERMRQETPDGTSEEMPLHRIARHRDLNGEWLDSRTAAVELLNLLRPIVAIATYIVFAAHALHRYPDAGRQLEREGGEYLECFTQEVRRFYPFTPFLGARVRREFDWQGHHFRTGELVVLDVYGTNHDPRLWPEPDEFRPERFRRWKGSPFDFIPQGGGDHAAGHRCAGEWITIESVKLALTFLTRFVTYEVPAQDLGFSLGRMPTGPRSGFVISRIQVPRG